MGLRARLALGSAGLLAILIALGVMGARWTSRLGGSIDVILRENYASVLACQDMKEALERLDGAALFAVAGDVPQGRAVLAVQAPRFHAALDRELANITLPGEGERATRVKQLFGACETALDAVFEEGLSADERRARYFQRLLPLIQGVKDTVGEIQQLNQESMVAANERARGEARAAQQQSLAVLVAGVAAAILFVGLMSQSILGPLRRLTRSVHEIERGNLDLVVPVGGTDEMGQLARGFNEMTARLRELRRTDQARLLRAQQVSRQAMDSLPHAVALLSPDGHVELANSTASNVLGLRAGSVPPEEHAGWLRPLLERAERAPMAPPASLDTALQVFRGGQEIFLLPQAIAIRDEDRRLLGVTLVVEDVTERRRVEEMKSGLLSTVSHELRTPLTSLQMSLHLLLDERVGTLSAEQSDLLVGAREDTERLRRIVEGLLDMARAERGAEQLRQASVSVGDLVQEVTGRVRGAFADEGVDLSVDVAPDLPRLQADPTRLGFVFENLLQNARRHTPAGGKVAVKAERRDGKLAVSVADTGPGIPPQYLARIFERFFQVPGTEAKGGVGLGLAISREIVQAHGGTLRAGSVPGQGATFIVELPLPGVHPVDPSAAARPA